MANYGQRADLSTSDYLKAAQRYPWLVALPILVLGFLAWFLLGRGAAVYEASADVLVQETQAQESLANQQGTFDPNFLRNEVSFAKSDVVRNEVSSRLNIEPFVDLDDVDVTIEASETSEVLTFTAQAATAPDSAEMANTYAGAYVAQRREAAVLSYDSSIVLLDEQLALIRENRAVLRTDLDAKIANLATLDPEGNQYAREEAAISSLESALDAQLTALDAEETAMITQRSDFRLAQNLAKTGIASVSNAAFVPAEPLPNSGIRGFIVAELVGLILGLLLAVTVYNMDDSLRDVTDVEAAFPDLAILGTLPYQASVRKRRALTVLSEPGSAYSEAIYQVRTSLRFMMLEKGVRLVVVTSSQPAEGKTTFSANFAWSMAGPDDRVVLIDGDLRRPVTHEHFGVDLAPGLTDLVLYKRQLDSLERTFDEQDPGFSFVPAGIYSGNPADFMGSNQLVRQVKSIAENALVVVDAAPVLPVSDARAIAGASDLTILIVRLEESHRKDVASALQNLRNAGATNVALVLVGGRVKQPSYYGTSGDKKSGMPSTGQPTLAPVSRRRPNIGAGRNATPNRTEPAVAPARARQAPATPASDARGTTTEVVVEKRPLPTNPGSSGSSSSGSSKTGSSGSGARDSGQSNSGQSNSGQSNSGQSNNGPSKGGPRSSGQNSSDESKSGPRSSGRSGK